MKLANKRITFLASQFTELPAVCRKGRKGANLLPQTVLSPAPPRPIGLLACGGGHLRGTLQCLNYNANFTAALLSIDISHSS